MKNKKWRLYFYMNQKERMIELINLARTQLMSLEKLGDSGIEELEGKKQS